MLIHSDSLGGNFLVNLNTPKLPNTKGSFVFAAEHTRPNTPERQVKQTACGYTGGLPIGSWTMQTALTRVSLYFVPATLRSLAMCCTFPNLTQTF